MALRRDEIGGDDPHEGFDWQREAACRGEHAPLFFPPPHFERKELRLIRERRAKSICRTCPVAATCLAYALEFREPHGVWGGLNEIERRELLVQAEAVDEPASGRGRGRQAHLGAGPTGGVQHRR
ncbi:MAG: WhiB family transcriptional regulator [Acidimicrobiales bacterium]